MLRRAIFSQLKTLAPRRPTADALGSLPLISARLSATRCYRPRGRQGAGRYNEEEEPYGKKGPRGAGRYNQDEEIPGDESDDSESESEEEEEEELIFSEKQLDKLRVGKQAQILPSHTGKVALPRTRTLYTVLRSPHVHKKSREQFETRVHRQLLFIRAEPHELEKKFFWLKRQCIFGAQHEVVVSYQTRLGDVKKIINGPSSKEKPKAI